LQETRPFEVRRVNDPSPDTRDVPSLLAPSPSLPETRDGQEPLAPERHGAEVQLPERRRRPLRTAGLALVALITLTALYQVLTWPDVARLANRPPETTAFLERARRLSEAEIPSVRWVPYDRISPHVKRAVLVSEDINFFSHGGFDRQEMRQAWETFREGGELRGASTLTQQLARNLWLSPSRNPWRKVKEAALTVQLERTLPKRRILEIYLNVVELGPGVFGFENGAWRYFGTSAASLSEAQAATLAAALPAPRRWYPGSGSSAAASRQRSILRRMAKAGWLWRVI
jgi:monofunctional biosynthetic peptidoglycan transglycosylase